MTSSAATDPVGDEPVRVDVDFHAAGKQFGSMLIPDSRNDGAWSNLSVPIVVISGGAGPTALLMAGNHGDEYEGQLAMLRLVEEVEADQVSGRLIVIPCLSMQASRMSTRLWPSGANFNRLFTGEVKDGPEHVLARYIARTLVPMADFVFDIHSGGRSLLFHPMTTMTSGDGDAADPAERARRERMVDAMLAWNADFHMSYAGAGQSGLLPQEAERAGKVVITGELGGAGYTTHSLVEFTVGGLTNVLRSVGLLPGPVHTRQSLDLPPTVLLQSTGERNYANAPESGLFEPLVDPGQSVTEGEPVGRIRFPERPERRPEVVAAGVSGVVVAIRAMPSTTQGDVLVTIGQPCERADIV